MSKQSGQMSLFELLPPSDDNPPTNSLENSLSVTKVHFLSQYLCSYQDLFKGFNELHVITYSYSLPFIEQLMHYFDRGEVILGFERLVTTNTATLIANQQFSINQVCKNAYLQERISNGEFLFYVLNDLVSHQKIYLLKSDDGRVSTITGSANFSSAAWEGDQLENLTVCDDYECFEVYEQQYETLRQFSSDISKCSKPISEDGDNADELPIFNTVKKGDAVLIHENPVKDEYDYLFHASKLSKEWEDRLKNAKIKPEKNGKVLLDVAKIKNVLTGIKRENEIRKERERIYPQMNLDYETHSVIFNQRGFNLTPDSSQITNDLNSLYEYMNGFTQFTKDTFRLKASYWRVLNYLFLSPFIARLRYEGSKYGYNERFFPMYMLIYGDSDAGKSGFISLAYQLMFGEQLSPFTPDNFSPKPMTALKFDVSGCPILIDELTPTYWKYAKDIVKMDNNLIRERKINHPTFTLLSNDINHVLPELSKRIIIINLDNRLGRSEAALNDKWMKSLIKRVSNSLYCEYLRNMFVEVEELIQEMRKHDTDDNNAEWIPDIFKVSSIVLMELMEKYIGRIPPEFKEYTWFDYMGDFAISERASKIIHDEYMHNATIFTKNATKNELLIDFSCYDDNEAKNTLNILKSELPADVECRIIGKKSILKLDSIEKLTGLKFKSKKGIFRIQK